jgi:uncharacterized protein
MKNIIISLLFLSIAMTNLLANPKTHAIAAEELLIVVGTEASLEKSIDQQLNLQLQEKQTLIPYKNIMRRFLEKYMGWQSIKGDLIRLYTQSFTETELRSIIAFYKTPSGQKMLNKQPEIMDNGAQIGLKKIQDHIPELQAMITAEATRIRKY